MATTRSSLWMALLLISLMSTQINGQAALNIKEPCKYFDPNEIDCDATTKTCYGTVHYHLGTANDLFERKQYKLSLPATLGNAQLVKASVDPIKVFDKELGSRQLTGDLYTYLDAKTDEFGYIRIHLSKTDKTLKKYHSDIEYDTYLFIPYQGTASSGAASADTFLSDLATFLETSALNSMKAATAEGHFLTKVEVNKVKKGRAIILASAFRIQLSALTGFTYDNSPTVFPAGKENADNPSESEVHYTNCRLNIGGNEEYVS